MTITEIMKYLIEHPELEELKVDHLTYSNLVKEYYEVEDYSSMPTPPIKYKSESNSKESGFFSYSSSETHSIEYDTQNPKYLKDLEKWENERILSNNSKKELVIFGPYGNVKIKLS